MRCCESAGMDKDSGRMETRPVKREAVTVMGLMRRFSDEDEHVGELWGQLGAYDARLQPLRAGEDHYGVAFLTGEPGVWDYLAGVPVEGGAKAHEGLVTREIPAGAYVLVESTLKDMDEAFDFIYETWLPDSPYERDPAKPVLDHYPPGTTSGSSPVFLSVPLKEKEG
jgi:predicted transcriptional regulator YdeE